MNTFKIAPEGRKIILVISVILIFVAFTAVFSAHSAAVIGTYILLFLMIIMLFFFRDPERSITEGDGVIVAAADGRVVSIAEVDEPRYINSPALRVSIFLSLLNVHVNRIPLDGEVEYLDYSKGSYLPAFSPKASHNNERQSVGIRWGRKKIMFSQIAGLIARRIICRLQKGEHVKKGDRYGMILFGSRMDMYLPVDVELRVRLHQYVKGGVTIIGILSHEK